MADSRAREGIAPAYLFLCLLIGGSAQGVWVNLILQLLAVILLAWTALSRRSEPTGTAFDWLRMIIAAGLVLVALQLIPLPPATWGGLPGRSVMLDGYATLGMAPPWLPVTMSANDSLTSVLRLLPAAAMLAAMVRLRAYRESWLAGALVAGTIGGVLLGALQVTGEAGSNSPYYFYRISNFGVATGFFANSNHMASLLVTAVPFLFALLAANRGRDGKRGDQRRAAVYALAGGSLLVLLLGLFLNGSLAGFALIMPVLLASLLLLVGWKSQRRWVAFPAAFLAALSVAGLALPFTGQAEHLGATQSIESRREVGVTTWSATKAVLPVGSGLGTFEKVYRLHEDPAAVERTYVNHAHNDYLELFLETGIPGLVLIAAFLLWWSNTAQRRWRDNVAGPYVKAAVIASAALLVHSLVDFPLRTAALSALFAASLALMCARARPISAQRPDLRPARHLEVR